MEGFLVTTQPEALAQIPTPVCYEPCGRAPEAGGHECRDWREKIHDKSSKARSAPGNTAGVKPLQDPPPWERARPGPRGRVRGPGRFSSPRRGAAAPGPPQRGGGPALPAGSAAAPGARQGVRSRAQRPRPLGRRGARGRPAESPWRRGGKRKRRRVRNGGAGCTSRSTGPPSSPRRDHKMEDAARGGSGAGPIPPRAAASRSPGSAGL